MRFRPRFSIFSALCGATIGISAFLPLPQNGAILGLPPLCPFYHLTQLPCPGCGLTRAFVCCAHGQLEAAFRWHPLGPILFFLAMFLVANSLAGRETPPASPRIGATLALVFGALWILRLSGVFTLPTA